MIFLNIKSLHTRRFNFITTASSVLKISVKVDKYLLISCTCQAVISHVLLVLWYYLDMIATSTAPSEAPAAQEMTVFGHHAAIRSLHTMKPTFNESYLLLTRQFEGRVKPKKEGQIFRVMQWNMLAQGLRSLKLTPFYFLNQAKLTFSKHFSMQKSVCGFACGWSWIVARTSMTIFYRIFASVHDITFIIQFKF